MAGHGHESPNKIRKREGHVPERDSTRTLSCSECRRLKLRCDRQWPCQSCVKRGCASICPTGSLTPGGGGNRFILHGSEQLHKKIKDMGERIAQLEDSVQCMWTSKTGGITEHPMLRKELLKIKLPPDTQNAESNESPSTSKDPLLGNAGLIAQTKSKEKEEKKDMVAPCDPSDDADCITAELGMLTLDAHGKGHYMGRSAKIEFILNSNENPEDPYTPDSASPSAFVSATNEPETSSAASIGGAQALPVEIRHIAESFFFSVPSDCPVDINTLKKHLPPRTRAWSLCETYFSHAGWFYSPINRKDFVDDVFSVIYNGLPTSNGFEEGVSSHSSPDSSEEETRTHGPHDLAVLFMVFAVGAVADLTLAPINQESEYYYALAKAAVCLESPWDGCSIALVQALNLMIYYSVQWNQKNNEVEGVWSMMGIAAKFAISLGLHRDPARWNLEEKEVQRRRWVFWELFTMDSWQSLSYGRPPSLIFETADCTIPEDPEEKRDETGKIIQRSFLAYKYRFVRDCIRPVIAHIFTTKPFTYAAVGELDKKVRNFDFGDLASELGPHTSIGALMQRHLLLCMREFTLLYIHRSFFTRVLISNPNSPLESPYAASVLATFRCAVSLLQIVKNCYAKYPKLISRFWLPWTYILTSGVVTGSICNRGPRSSLTPAAYHQLCLAVELCESAKGLAPNAARALPLMLRLKQKAYQAIQDANHDLTSSLPSPKNSADKSNEVDVLEAYGGKARLVRVDGHQHKDHASNGSSSSGLGAGGSRHVSPGAQASIPVFPPQPQERVQERNMFFGIMGGSEYASPVNTASNNPWLPNPIANNSNAMYQPDFSGLAPPPVTTRSDISPQFSTSTSSLDSTPYFFTQEPINPSSMPVAVVPFQPNGGSENLRASRGDDFSWLDGFGVGTPMDQFPVIGNQTVPAIFNTSTPTLVNTPSPDNSANTGAGNMGLDQMQSWESSNSGPNSTISYGGGQTDSMGLWGMGNDDMGFTDVGMDMTPDETRNGTDQQIRSEPALDDDAWTQYMQKLFTSGGGSQFAMAGKAL